MNAEKSCFDTKKLVRTPPGFIGDKKAHAVADGLDKLLRSRDKGDPADLDVSVEDIHTLGVHNRVPYVRSILAKFVGIERTEDDELFHAVTTGSDLPTPIQEHLELRLSNAADEQTSLALGYLMFKKCTPALNPYYDSLPENDFRLPASALAGPEYHHNGG